MYKNVGRVDSLFNIIPKTIIKYLKNKIIDFKIKSSFRNLKIADIHIISIHYIFIMY
jgi:hypothetical protein